MQGNRPNTGFRSSQMADFRLDPGFSAVISLRLITGNLCATSRVFWPGITPTRGVRADSSSHLETATVVGTQGVTDLSSAGGQLPHRISARALSCLSNPTASGRWTRHSATSLKLSTPAAVTTQRRRQRPVFRGKWIRAVRRRIEGKALAAKPRLTVMVSGTDVESHRRRTVRRARNGPRWIRDHSQRDARGKWD